MAYSPLRLSSHLFMTSEAGFEPQHNNNFEFQVTGLGTMTRAGGEDFTSAEKQMLANSSDLILSLRQAFTPAEDISDIRIAYGNGSTRFAGVPSYNDGTIIWNDFYDKDIEYVLKLWQRAAYDPETGAVGDASNYKRTAYLTMYSPSGRVARRWKLFGVWIRAVNGDDMSNENATARGLSAVISYDYAVRMTKEESSTSIG